MANVFVKSTVTADPDTVKEPVISPSPLRDPSHSDTTVSPVNPDPSPTNEPVKEEPVTPPEKVICCVEKSPNTKGVFDAALLIYNLFDSAIDAPGPAALPKCTLPAPDVRFSPAEAPTDTLLFPDVRLVRALKPKATVEEAANAF